MSSDDQRQERPTYDPVQLKDGAGYFVRVTWPDGFEQQINDFADEADARAWIAANERDWHERAPRRVPRET